MIRNSAHLLLQWRRAYSFKSAKYDPQRYVATEFERRWQQMTQPQREALEASFADLQRQDWRTLTTEQKRNSIIMGVDALVYTICYGVPELDDPHENKKVALGVAALIGASCLIFYGLRQLGIPRKHS